LAPITLAAGGVHFVGIRRRWRRNLGIDHREISSILSLRR
jgi:hypothetical protein